MSAQPENERGRVSRFEIPGRATKEPCAISCFSWLKTGESQAANLLHFVDTALNLQGFEVMSF